MLTKSKGFVNLLSSQKHIAMLFLILFSIFTFSFSQTETCTEQWREIELAESKFITVQDAKILSSKTDGLTFEFERQEASSTSAEIGGAIWYKEDFSHKRGLLISFKPVIKYDTSYFGNMKYPQGFAIVFTSSTIDGLIGEKGSGLGYQGIMNAVVFEFDFIRQSANNDVRYPHFSIHYNITGTVSANSIGYQKKTINVALPNFYDSSLDGYYKNIIFELQIIGSRVILRTNRDSQPLVNATIVEFQKLLQQEDIHFGITSSMNQNKKVTINNFKISEVSIKEKGVLAIKGNENTVKAGEEITLLYSIESVCGEKLKIYSNQYTSSDFVLKINNQPKKLNSISFDDKNNQVQMVIVENKENIYTGIVEFEGRTSSPTQFTVTTSDVQRYELCEVNSTSPYNITSDLEQTKDYFYVRICSYDQFSNPKKSPQFNVNLKYKGPNNIILTDNSDNIEFLNSDKTLLYKIPFNTFGLYEIFNENFEGEKIRYYNLLPKSISPEKSEVSILYDYNIIQEDTKNVSLIIKLRDNFGRDIPKVILDEIKCDFSETKLIENGVETKNFKISYKNDSVLIIVDKPTTKGKFRFVPKVRCNNIDLTELYCGFDSVTKINKCDFYNIDDSSSVGAIQAYSDYSDEFITYKTSEARAKTLYVSLDEKENKKLTEIILLDKNEAMIFNEKTVSAKLGMEDLDVRSIGNKYFILLPSQKNRQNYSPVDSYSLVISVDSKSFTIPIRFNYLDIFMSNTKLGVTPSSYKAFYKQASMEIEASETVLLFDIYEFVEDKYLGEGKSLDVSKVTLLIDEKSTNNKIEKYINYISVINYDLTKAGNHKITLKYDNKVITEINVVVVAKEEAYYLGNENGLKIKEDIIKISIEKLSKYVLLDKFENQLKDNQVFKAFAKIRIISSLDGFLFKPNYDGKIHLLNYGKNGKFEIEMRKGGKTYQFTTEYTEYTPSFDAVSPFNSYGIFDSNTLPVLKNKKIGINLYLKDKYGNEITGPIKKEQISVYVQGENLKEIIQLDTNDTSINEYIQYSGQVGLIGDYVVKIFINDIPVECKACNFRNNIKGNLEKNKTVFYILGNKRKIPMMNSYKLNKKKIALVNKDNFNFAFQMEEKDEFLNDFKESKTLSLKFSSEDASVDTKDITICSVGNNEDERGFFKFCEGVYEKVQQLKDGLYKIHTTYEDQLFYIYLTNSLFDDILNPPYADYSMILSKDKTIYGKTDIPGSFILDLRTQRNKRLKNLDPKKVKISNSNINIEVVEGPEKGLLTVFMLAKPGNYEFNLSYDNKKVIEETYTYISVCGFAKKLEKQKQISAINGNYIFFTVKDEEGNECKNYYWNDINSDDYRNSILLAKGETNNIYYKTDTYYNQLTNTLILHLDEHASGKINLSSNLITIDTAAQSLSLNTTIIDANHFYASITNNVLSIKPLDYNYNEVETHNIKKDDFDVALFRKVNDDFVIIKKDFEIKPTLTVDFANDLMDAAGKYFYVIYFRGKEIFCQNCIVDRTENSPDLTKTKVFHKEANGNYIQTDSSNISPLFKSNFPFFKINLFSKNNNMLILTGVEVSLFTSSKTIDTKIKHGSNGNIYVYLTKEGRTKYLELSPMEKLTLKITYSGSSYEVNYYVLNKFVEEPKSIEYCAQGALPSIANNQNTYIKRVDEELEVEIQLTGCASELNEIKTTLKVVGEGNAEGVDAEIIPTESYGGYLLFLPNNLPVTNSKHYYIVNKNSKSIKIDLSVIPGYDIATIEFKEDENMKENQSNKIYTYVLAKLKDSKGNEITNVGRNLFIKDINQITVEKLPYFYTYDDTKKAFRVQIPINGHGNIEVKSSIGSSTNSIKIDMGDSGYLFNSLVNVQENNNKYTFDVSLRDDFYKTMELTEIIASKMVIKYITINPVTEEVLVKKLKPNFNAGKLEVTLPENIPKYSIYGFIPCIRLIPQVCPSCIKKNDYPNFIYSVGDSNYVPNNLSKKLFLNKGQELPVFLYIAHKTLSISTETFTLKEMESKYSTKLYLLSEKEGSDSRAAEFPNSRTFSVDSKQGKLTYQDTTNYIAKYGNYAFTMNNLDNKEVTFFIEIRGESDKLVVTTPKITIDDTQKENIKRITVLNTCFGGVYFVKITFVKSDNFVFNLKLGNNQRIDGDSMYFNVIPGFPDKIVLNDRKRMNSKIIVFSLSATNANAEEVCDQRLNLYIDNANMKRIRKMLIDTDGSCSLFVEFYGDAVIKSNIGNFKSDITNDAYSLYNVNPQFSSASISPNIFFDPDQSLSVNIIEKSPSLTTYEKDEIITQKKLYGYKYISPTKIKLKKEFTGLYSSEYNYSANKFNFEKDDIFVLISSILDNNLYPTFVYYQMESQEQQAVSSIKGYYLSQDLKVKDLASFTEEKKVGNAYELNLPMFLSFKFLDSKGYDFIIKKGEWEKVEAQIIDNNEEKSWNLIVRKNNDNIFIVQFDINVTSIVSQLPTVFAKIDHGYFLRISYGGKKFYSKIIPKQNVYHVPYIKGFQYDYPDNSNSLNPFEVCTDQKKSELNIISQTPNIHHICLFKESKIFNKHLDPNKLKITLSTNSGDENVIYANSYTGCFAFSTKTQSSINGLKVIYDGKEPTISISINTFSASSLSFTLKEDKSTSVFREGENSPTLAFDSSLKYPIYEYLRVYVNEKQAYKTDITVIYDIYDDLLKINIPSTYFKSTTKTKNIAIIYDNGLNTRKILGDKDFIIQINQSEYNTTNKKYQFKGQDPLTLKAGNNIFYYLSILNSDDACYYENFTLLNTLNAKINIDNSKTITSNVTKRIKIEGIAQCEYLYLLNFTETSNKSGSFKLELEDKQIKENLNIYIAPQEIDESKSMFIGPNTMKAGETIRVNFTGTDKFCNNINYFDLHKRFDIKLRDSTGKDLEKKEIYYSYITKVSPDNTHIIIDLTVNFYDNFTLLALKDGKEMKLNSTLKIRVSYGECSTFGAEPTIKTIDNRNEFYAGERISVGMKCKDSLGNIVETKGNETFIATIKKEGNDLTYSYNKTFENGEHIISFIPSSLGIYTIDISLNGKKYGNTLTAKILEIDTTKYNCMDKRFVDRLEDCDTNKYREFIKQILGQNYVCNTNGLYKCGGNCVMHTKECGCLNGLEEYNGYCYDNNTNPISLVDKNKKLVTCLAKIKSKNPDSNAVICKDGSCRAKEEECNTKFECPIGFKVCGVKCIFLGATCNETVTCGNGEVLCWDLSCAKGYDLCPTRITCPRDKVLCPDGSCQVTGHCLQPEKRSCSANEYQCPDFSCVPSKEDCTKNIVCDLGLSLCENGKCQESCQNVKRENNQYRCPNGDFVENSELCPSDMIALNDYIKCPSGGIAINVESCKYIQKKISVTCPKSKPILCPDYECVTKKSECNIHVPTCPSHKPYQCWNNECRVSLDECPTPVTCPKESPIICQNGLCVKSTDECEERKTEKCSLYRCFDGTCASSMELCPTYQYCGEGKIKCWNGVCANKIEDCRATSLEACVGDLKYRCPDGSCRKSSHDCSTISVCPPHLPIKCFDNSCRANIKECPAYQDCGQNKTSCPDGTCASSFETCNTVITCPISYPFLCYDQSCKAVLSDCPEPPKCSKNEVLCPDGSCASSIQNCEIFEPCDATYPVRCEKNTCTDDFNKCLEKDKRCPIGYITCPNGDCKKSEYLCEPFQCPKNKPYLCKEGICVHNKELCDDPETGCPYNARYKCEDGTCVKDISKCSQEPIQCSDNQKKCPDGSCIKKNLDCPLINGCYKDKPFKCADGTCINPETTNCSLVFCPYNNPYKCPNGYCVSKSSDCPKELPEKDLIDCGEGYVMCVDGRCVESSDYCRPAFKCENGYELCPDHSCRIGSENCPKQTKCPESRNISCPDTHICVRTQAECASSGLVCPDGYHKCEVDGLCVSDASGCDSTPTTNKNGCLNGGVKCQNGRCMKNLDECALISDACPDDSSPYLCSNGECTDDLSKCPLNVVLGKCQEGKIRCQSGRCVENKKSEILAKCTNNIGCPLEKPYRCSNGECVKSYRNCDVTSLTTDGVLESNIVCDASKPYLCSDKSCVSDPSFCKSFSACPEGKKNCHNGYFVDSDASCNEFSGYCPVASPIHCPSGTCVDDVVKCSPPFTIPLCNEGEFYCSRLNKCLTKKLDCLIYIDIEKKERTVNRQLSENFVDPLTDDNYINIQKKPENDFKLFIEEQSQTQPPVSNETEPQKPEEKGEETICYDGSIVSGKDRCPIVPACKIGQYRCENGACATKKENCVIDEDYVCVEGKKKCPDGLCHKDCNEVLFHGCEVGKYQCSNGLCVEDKYDCIGHSMCENLMYPFRCMNGECKSTPEECEVINRLGNVKQLTYSFNKADKIEFSFAHDYNRRPIASIEIPGFGLKLNQKYSQLSIDEVASSLLYNSQYYNHSTELIYNISNSICASDGMITFENSVMSPIFKFYSKNTNINFKIDGLIKLHHNEYEYDASGIYTSDYCLAKFKGYNLNNDLISNDTSSGWECVDRQTTSGQKEFKINEFGVYAIVINPLRDKINYFGDTTAKNFFLENVKIILIVFACIIVFVALVFYVFVRVSRYREKYHENRAKILLLQQQKQEYENMTTDIFGQTLGDNINGIVYKANPAYTVKDEIKKTGTSLEDEIEKLQIECRNVNDQNERLQKEITDITEQYKVLSASIDNTNQ